MKHNDRVILSYTKLRTLVLKLSYPLRGATKWSRRISFVFGLSSFALFAACTDYVGEIDDQIDELKELQARADSQKSSSSEEEDTEPETSSSSFEEVVKNPSSSSRGEVIIVTKPSSSSITILDMSERSSSSFSVTIIDNPDPDPTSSAGIEITPISGLGSCAPASSPINKGSSVKWKFSGSQTAGYKPMDFAKATFAWNFPGGTPATDVTPSTSAAITYANSGTANATLTLTLRDGVSETIQCSPLQVNGEPITCTCNAMGGDIVEDAGVATWTASCTSASEITSYVWDGVDAGQAGVTFSYTFAAKGDSHMPTLEVGNSDNTVETVTCPKVTATDAGEESD